MMTPCCLPSPRARSLQATSTITDKHLRPGFKVLIDEIMIFFTNTVFLQGC